jgi:hypothetical protein
MNPTINENNFVGLWRCEEGLIFTLLLWVEPPIAAIMLMVAFCDWGDEMTIDNNVCQWHVAG